VYLLEANFDEFFSCSMVCHNPILDWSTPQKDAKLLRGLMVESRKGSRKKPSGTPGGHIGVSCDDHPTHHGFSGWIGNSAGNTHQKP
jgi:hypothetical protein